MNIISTGARHAPPVAQLSLFDWTPPAPASRTPLHAAAHRIAVRYHVPYGVALAHCRCAGLGLEGIPNV